MAGKQRLRLIRLAADGMARSTNQRRKTIKQRITNSQVRQLGSGKLSTTAK